MYTRGYFKPTACLESVAVFLKETFIQLFASYRLDFLKALKTWSLVEIDDSS